MNDFHRFDVATSTWTTLNGGDNKPASAAHCHGPLEMNEKLYFFMGNKDFSGYNSKFSSFNFLLFHECDACNAWGSYATIFSLVQSTDLSTCTHLMSLLKFVRISQIWCTGHNQLLGSSLALLPSKTKHTFLAVYSQGKVENILLCFLYLFLIWVFLSNYSFGFSEDVGTYTLCLQC